MLFDGFELELLGIDNGIGQGEASSMILYLIYCYTLVAIPVEMGGDGRVFVDDNFFTAIGNTVRVTLQQGHSRLEVHSDE